MPEFELIGEIADVELIARGPGIRDLSRLNRQYGKGKWRKLKGYALIRLRNGRERRAELHWYEAHGIGKREIKRKRYIE
jgi:hypothetical protein